MKTIHLAIIAILSVVIFSSSLAYAEQPLLDFYNNSSLVLVGKIISLSQVPTTSNPSQSPYQTRYDIQVEQYYKNPQVAKLITVYGYAKGIYFGQDPTFNVGDRVFLYLDQQNGYYKIQPHSFALNNDCDARPMVPMPTLPFEPPPLSTPAHGRVFEFQSAEGTRSDTFGLGDKIHINFIAENDLPVIKYATLNFTIKKENNTKLIFNDTKQVTIPACNGNIPVSWDFVPKTSGTYLVNVSTSDSLSLGKQTVLFTEPSMGGSFDVRRNTSGISLEKAFYLPSPLTQLRSGIKAEDVKCADGLTLVIKSEDDFPACVKPDTANILRERGWAANVMMNHGPPITPFGPRTPLYGNITNTKTSINTTNSFQIKNRIATFDLQINPNLRGYAGRYTTDMIAVVRGDIIAWENSDSTPHTITSTNGVFDSGTISAGSKFTLDTTPLVAGYYDYYDKFNNTLTGSIRIIDPHLYNDSVIINMAKQLNATKLFLEKYPNASENVEHKYYDSVNFEAEKIDNINSEQSRTLQLEITFDKDDTGVMNMSLNCLGHISTSISNVTENIESGWCLTHLG